MDNRLDLENRNGKFDMRKITVSEFVSFDGVVENPRGQLHWNDEIGLTRWLQALFFTKVVTKEAAKRA